MARTSLRKTPRLLQALRTEPGVDRRKALLAEHFDRLADERDLWKAKNRYYYKAIETLCLRFVPQRSRVLELGCSTGDLLASLRPDPSGSLGVDLSPRTVERAKAKFPHLRFVVGDAENLNLPGTKFDFIVMSDVVGHLRDLYTTLRGLHTVSRPGTRLIVTYYNFLWEGILQLGERLGVKMPQHYQNWLSMNDLQNLFYLSDFQVVTRGTALLLPKRVPVISNLVNEIAPRIIGLRHLCLVQYFVAEPTPLSHPAPRHSVSVVVPCRNEADNIEAAVQGIPPMGRHTEIIFVDGHSTDGSVERIEEAIERYRGAKDIKLIHQAPRGREQAEAESPDRMLRLGKGDAVRKGFDVASGEIVMILDSDLTVAPEDLPRFVEPLAEGKAEFVNGSRLVYPMQDQSMRFVNLVGNKIFSLAFSWLLGQPLKDTLCGTKALFKKDYERIKAGRSHFGDFDPFGDFDLLFGAARLGLKIVDMPIHYRHRVAGVSKVRVVSHGLLLLRMTLIGFQKLKLKHWMEKLGNRAKKNGM